MAHTRPRILIVDHDVDNREMLPVWLDREQDRFEICTASSCREAREMIIRHRFDVYILDYLMPDVTGADFCKVVRELDPNGAIIVYSAMNTPNVRIECTHSGADLFLLKPDDMDMIAPSIDELLRGRQSGFMPNPTQSILPGI